jgi:hypothetical protein
VDTYLRDEVDDACDGTTAQNNDRGARHVCLVHTPRPVWLLLYVTSDVLVTLWWKVSVHCTFRIAVHISHGRARGVQAAVVVALVVEWFERTYGFTTLRKKI